MVDRRKVLQGTLGGLLGATSLAGLADAAASATRGPSAARSAPSGRPGQPAAAPSTSAPSTSAPSTPPRLDTPLSATTPRGLVRLNAKLAVVSGGKDNVLALATGGAGVLLIDSGSPGRTRELLDQLRTLSGGRPHVHTLINTHWHPDQTGSNAALGKAGARIIAQHKTWDWVSTEHYVPPPGDHYVKALPKAAWPTQTFYSKGAMTAGGEHIEYGHLVEAHTDGDCYVYFRDSNVLAVGHAASPAQDPQLDWYGGGWIGGRLDALTQLYKLADGETRIVPAFGPPVSRSALKAEHDMLQVVYNRMVKLVRKGYSAEDMLNAGVMKGLARTFRDPRTFVFSAFKGLWGHEDELAPNIV